MQNLSIEKLRRKKDRKINKTQNGAQQQKQRKQANGVTAEPSGWDHCYIIAFFYFLDGGNATQFLCLRRDMHA